MAVQWCALQEWDVKMGRQQLRAAAFFQWEHGELLRVGNAMLMEKQNRLEIWM